MRNKANCHRKPAERSPHWFFFPKLTGDFLRHTAVRIGMTAALTALLLTGCSSPSETLAGVDISKALVLEAADTHGGFHGDGETYQKLLFSEAPDFPEDWQELPMEESLRTLLYGGQRKEIPYSGFTNDLGESIFPEVTQGKWFFQDRHPQCTDPHDVEAVFDRNSKNFTAALWDEENLVMYYFAWDS